MTSQRNFNHVDGVEPAEVSVEDGGHGVYIRFLLSESLKTSAPLGLFQDVCPPSAEHRMDHHPHADEFVYGAGRRAALAASEEEREGGPGWVPFGRVGTVHWLWSLDAESPVEIVRGSLSVRTLEEAGYRFLPDHRPAVPRQR